MQLSLQMIEIRWNTKNHNNLIMSHDLQLHRLINSFMHRNFAGEAVQLIVQSSYNNRS